jgi:DTW domain-containing protein YfiP
MMQSARLENFDIDHHHLNRDSCAKKIAWWKEEIATGKRCGVCWLRPYDCFCGDISSIRRDMNACIENDDILAKVRVGLYYHYQELGRSANTAHLLEVVAPSICENLVFGDSANELKFMKEIVEEYKSDDVHTCIMYPHSSALSLNEWLDYKYSHKSPVRLIVLDGTYGQASRQWKFLSKGISLLQKEVGCEFPLPVIKLDLSEKGCRSAISGIMVIT